MFTRIPKLLFFCNKWNRYFWCQLVIIINIVLQKRVSNSYYLWEKKISIWKWNLHCFMSCSFWQKWFIKSQKSITMILNIEWVVAIASQNHTTYTNSPIYCLLVLGQLGFELFRRLFCLPFHSLKLWTDHLEKVTGGCPFSSRMHWFFRQ